MSWLRGKKTSANNLKTEEAINRSTTPTPANPNAVEEKRTYRSGLLTIRVMGAEGLAVPTRHCRSISSAVGFDLPAGQSCRFRISVIDQSAASRQQDERQQVCRSLPAVLTANLPVSSIRDSVQRAQCWWLPYLVMEYEVNQVLITPAWRKPREAAVYVPGSFVRVFFHTPGGPPI